MAVNRPYGDNQRKGQVKKELKLKILKQSDMSK